MDIKSKSERISPPVLKESSSTPSTPTPRPPGPQLISQLPRAEEAAMKTFLELSDNSYQYKTLGRSRQAEDSLVCDCSYEPGIDPKHVACGDGSDCINRLTQVECQEDECRCRSHCRNQRFQRKQYAQFEIVHTEMKGYGLRAATAIPKDAFIYEYIGEVVSHPSFVKRMREYAEEGIRHFYFMMLQKDEFIDATKKGGVGRFANHSCNPNCYVAKWTVGEKVRMGIFSKRRIQKDEELTFNYNVDRYGHDAQPCYCGEANCVGFIGGKTQTDIATMDDLVLDALGMSADVEALGLKGNKKKKGKKMDEDFVPILTALAESEVPKVVSAIRQTADRMLLIKLITRIKLTQDQPALRQLMRLRGFSLMSSILEDYSNDLELCTLVLECLPSWPLITRNKIEDSKIEEPVKFFTQSENEKLRTLANQLIDQWAILETGYRIPKRGPRTDENGTDGQPELLSQPETTDDHRPVKRPRFGEHDSEAPTLSIKPLGHTHRATSSSKTPQHTHSIVAMPEARSTKPTKEELAAIIAAANAISTPTKPTLPATNGNTDTPKKSNKESPKKPKATKEQRLMKLVGPIVVECMSKYRSKIDHDLFKQKAREVTHMIAEKEKKSVSYANSKMDTLSDEKREKIKKFVKDFMAKFLHNMKRFKSNDMQHGDESTSPGEAPRKEPGDTPNSNDSTDSIAAFKAEDDSSLMNVDGPDGDGVLLDDAASGNGVQEDPWDEGQRKTISTNGAN